MSDFLYSTELINSAFTYQEYRENIANHLAKPVTNEAEGKMRPYTEKNIEIMAGYDESTEISKVLKEALEVAPPTIWLILTEGWCGDAAFNVPVLAAIEKALPEKVKVKILLRDSNLELMDAHLTDGGRSIPKMIVLDNNLAELGTWGPRPNDLQTLMKGWKNEGLGLKEIIPKVQDWYNVDATVSLQKELTTLVKSYS